jgi:hypothetical protein
MKLHNIQEDEIGSVTLNVSGGITSTVHIYIE